MSDGLYRLLVAAAAVFLVMVLAKLLKRAKPSIVGGPRGTLQPERWSAWFTVLGGLAMFAVGVWKGTFESGGIWALLVAIAGAAIAGFMAPSVTSFHAVHWSEHGIEGPSRTFGPTLGTARTMIAWPEIVRTGRTITSYWYVESGDGRRVYWSQLYKGYGALIAELRRKRPSLDFHF